MTFCQSCLNLFFSHAPSLFKIFVFLTPSNNLSVEFLNKYTMPNYFLQPLNTFCSLSILFHLSVVAVTTDPNHFLDAKYHAMSSFSWSFYPTPFHSSTFQIYHTSSLLYSCNCPCVDSHDFTISTQLCLQH